MKKPIALSPEAQSRAVLYLRFSSESQREESIEGQRRECLEYAKRSGIEVVGEYVDRAKSATTDDRPDFQRMIRASSSQGFGIVLVWKLDRFARNRYDSLKYKAILRQNGVRLLSATERIGKDVLENLIASLVLEALDDKKAIKEIASYVYRNQSRDSNELTKMRAQASKIQSQIDNFARAIGMGVITETTRSTLMKLEAERAEIAKRMQKESAVRRRYTKSEIVASLEILKAYLTEADFKKKALFESFVEQVCVFKDGKVVVAVNIFGSKAKLQNCDISKLKELEKIDIKSRETVECLYFHQRGFVAVGRLPKRDKKPKHRS